MRWFFLNAAEIGLISLAGSFYLVASKTQMFHTPIRLASVALAIWLVFSVLGDAFQRIPSTIRLLAEQQEVKARYLQNIITSIALRCVAIAAFITVVRVAQ